MARLAIAVQPKISEISPSAKSAIIIGYLVREVI
jgi:hypothetical protein